MSDLDRYTSERRQCVAARNKYLDLVRKLDLSVKSLLTVDDVDITDNRIAGMNSQSSSKCVVEAREWPTIDKIITHFRKFSDLRKKHAGRMSRLRRPSAPALSDRCR